MALSGPPPLNPKGVRRRSYAAAYSVSGLSGSMAMSLTPVSSLIFSTCDQVFPPSTVLYTPRSGFGPHRCPSAATYTISGLFGWITIRPMWRVASSPIFFQVFPLSSDLYAPSPQEELCRLFGSPVPTHTTEGSDGAIAMSPIVDTLSLSNIGSHVVPLLVVFHTPPEAVPTYTMFGLLSTTAKSSMRPPITAGPISRNSRFLNLSVEFCGAPAVMRAPANRNPPQARMLGRALDLCFISLSSRARPGILLRSRALRTKLFLRTATNSDETDALGCGRVSCGSSRPLFSLFPFQAAVRRCRVPFLPITATHARLSSRSHPSHGLRESF